MANELSNLKPPAGSRRPRKRIGRGEGSGTGKTSGRGTKGAQSRTGFKDRARFEGGQMPIHMRLPKKGFTNPFRKDYTIVNLSSLASFAANSVVTEASLTEAGRIKQVGKDGVKILGNGEIGVALHVRVAKLSRVAAEKITAAGGTIEGPLPTT